MSDTSRDCNWINIFHPEQWAFQLVEQYSVRGNKIHRVRPVIRCTPRLQAIEVDVEDDGGRAISHKQ